DRVIAMSNATQPETEQPAVLLAETPSRGANRELILEPANAHPQQLPLHLSESRALVGQPTISAVPLSANYSEPQHALIVEQPTGWVLRARGAECRRNGLRVSVAVLQSGDHLSIAGKEFRIQSTADCETPSRSEVVGPALQLLESGHRLQAHDS